MGSNTRPSRSHKQGSRRPICKGLGSLKGSCRFLFRLCHAPWHTSCDAHIIFITSIWTTSISFAHAIYVVKHKQTNHLPIRQTANINPKKAFMMKFFSITQAPERPEFHDLCKVFVCLFVCFLGGFRTEKFSWGEFCHLTKPEYEQEAQSSASSAVLP